jgi:hypothetical protein
MPRNLNENVFSCLNSAFGKTEAWVGRFCVIREMELTLHWPKIWRLHMKTVQQARNYCFLSPSRPGGYKKMSSHLLTNSAIIYEPKCGGRSGFLPMSTTVHRSPKKLWRSNSIFNFWFQPVSLTTHWHGYGIESPVAKFIVPDWGYKVDSDIGLSQRPASLM